MGNPNFFRQVKRIAIDEISFRKGRGSYLCVIMDLDTRRVLDILPNRSISTLNSWLSSHPHLHAEQIKLVCTDMYPSFRALRGIFKSATFVKDRFHVMQLFMDDFERLLCKFKSNKIIKSNVNEILGTKQGRLKKAVEDELRKYSCLYQGWKVKQEIYEIFSEESSVPEGKRKLQNWLEISSEEVGEYFKKSFRAIKNHLDDIANYFIDRSTTSPLEGMNNKIRLLKLRGYGYPNFQHFRDTVLLSCGPFQH